MDTVIYNTKIITGDSKTEINNGAILIENGIISSVKGSCIGIDEIDAKVKIDAAGFVALPGVINGHCHGCAVGPLFPSGSKPVADNVARRNVLRMMRQGVTTLVNLCGFATMEDAGVINRQTPINIKIGTCHTTSSLESALLVDGEGIQQRHRSKTVFQMLKDGAVAIGEMGSGASLGGGVASYKYIPEEIEKAAGKRITASQAEKIKTAVLGRRLDPINFNESLVRKLIDKFGLTGGINVDEMKRLVIKTVMTPIEPSLKSFDEACGAAQKTGTPVIFHNSLVSAGKILECAGKFKNRDFKIIAGHSNHPSFNPDEAVDYAKKMKAEGCIIDVSSLDCIITRWMNGPENIIALAKEHLIDTISTDYGGGHWDGILETVHFLVNNRLASLPKAVAMATGNVAKAIPSAAPSRGFIEKGGIADIVLVDEKNTGRVETVIVGGEIVFDQGRFQ